MSNRSLVEIEGFEQLRFKIKKLGDKAKTKELRKILRKSAQPTVKAARLEAPQSKQPHMLKGGKKITPGNTKKSIGVKVLRRAKNPMLVVRPRTTKKNDGFYARSFVIFGHNIYRKGFKRNRKGNRRANAKGTIARIPSNPFMNRAQTKTERKVSTDALKSTEKYIQKLINQL